MGIINKLRSKIFKKIDNTGFRSSKQIAYSQSGEDLIVKFIFESLKIDKPTYLDLGAHHPDFFNNTCLFYNKGSRGINVEPDPYLINEFLKLRPEDINLNVGVGFNEQEETSDFYVMTEKVLNTFSKEEALKIEGYGTYKIEQVLQIPLVPVSSILKHFKSGYPNFVTLDVEGLDFKIIQTFDFIRYRPEVFCIETLTYTEDRSEKKITDIIDYMLGNGYFIYADTYINTIFVDKKAWLNR